MTSRAGEGGMKQHIFAQKGAMPGSIIQTHIRGQRGYKVEPWEDPSPRLSISRDT